ncbi:MAG: DNA translocase FtsK [Spirochaetes bacterium]|nr:DNA translocase FtsK [Spirochaetota bacterium]
MFSNRQYKEVTGILLILISIVIFLSLLTFNLNDIKMLGGSAAAGSKSINNIIGPVGIYLSDFLRGSFGYCSYIIVIIFALSGWSVVKKGFTHDLSGRLFSLIFLMITGSAFISLLIGTTDPHFSGGYIGNFISKSITGIFGEIGSLIVILMVNIIGFILLGIVSLSSIMAYLENKKIKEKIITSAKKIFFFNSNNIIPQNDLESVIQRKGKKIPWIIKKRIIIGAEDTDQENEVKKEIRKLIEHRGITPAIEDRSFAEFFDKKQKEVEYFNSRTESPSADKVSLKRTFETEGESGEDEETFISEDIVDAEISYTNYADESESGDIVRNRIKSVVLEHEIQPAEILDEYYDEDEEEEDEEEPALLIDRNKTIPEGDDRPASYIPKVFDEIKYSEKYYIPESFLTKSDPIDAVSWKAEAKRNSELLVKTLGEFGIESRVINVHRGPVITLYEIQIAPGIKVNRIVNLSDDIAMALAAFKVRIVAPIPGKSAIGVEIPNSEREMVTMGDIVESSEYKSQTLKLKVGIGKDILGKPVTFDLKKQPHLLIAGATGAGKSICLNSIICDLIFNYDPNYVRFILVDPKMVELQLYNGVPHLLAPVITESYLAPKALKWATQEMERRYKLLSQVNARDIDKYNEKIKGYEDLYEKLPYIVIVIDELADLMMIAAKEIEGFITRIAQKARAIGIHMILATQRPSVDIITGIIKANFPARIAFQVPQKIDSRTILDQNGAETLLGKGDMLYQSPVSSFPTRLQGAFITEEEIMQLVKHTRKFGKPKYVDIDENLDNDELDETEESEDELFVEAIKIIEETKKASASYLQRRLSIGYNRAARIIELMEDRGYVGPQQGSKPREVFI